MSLASVTSDCGTQGKVCTPQGCATQAVDTLGAGDQVEAPSSELFGDRILTQSSRTITQIEAYLTLPANRDLTWVIYEREKFLWRFDSVFSTVTVGTGTGFQSSGTISYTLKADTSYFIGVNVAGGSFGAYYGIEPKGLSFGVTQDALVAREQTSSPSPATPSLDVWPQPDRIYYLRVTTTR
jgi:hypothetical protein